MALRNILTQQDPILRKRSRSVIEFGPKTAELLDDLVDTLKQANGLGLASPQVGLLRRAVVILDGEQYLELVNPEILETEGEEELTEACLSCPNLVGYVKRPKKIKLKAQDRNGKWFEREFEDVLAQAAAHEIDHLDGILFIDRASRVLSDEEFAEEQAEKEEEEQDDAPKGE